MIALLLSPSRFVPVSIALLLGLPGCGDDDGSITPPPAGDAVALESVATGLEFPLYLTSPPDDPRLFIVERAGRIRIVADGALVPAPFLDISDRVSTGGERGLLGLAFPPDYATSGRFVVHYSDPQGDTQISTFTVTAEPNVADPNSEQSILTVDQPFANHNGGQITFGPDGMLYIGLGDGGDGGDPFDNGQSLGTLLGKILRLDLDAASPYGLPADNPFAGQTGARGEIWAYGLRNPWRFSFDQATGDLYIADVGQQSREEIDVAAGPAAGRGLNYGWDVMEGTACFEPATGCDRTGLTLPVLDYGHDDGCSVTGGYVYRGAAIPSLQGHYLYSDYCGGWVRSFRLENGGAAEATEWPTLAPGGSVTSFGEDADGELYIMSTNGGVYRIVPE